MALGIHELNMGSIQVFASVDCWGFVLPVQVLFEHLVLAESEHLLVPAYVDGT